MRFRDFEHGLFAGLLVIGWDLDTSDVGLNLRGHQAKLQSPMYGRAFRPNFRDECQSALRLPDCSLQQSAAGHPPLRAFPVDS